jgi:pSer/pThr/pTyr-binding forkhead associated (FHA) protein
VPRSRPAISEPIGTLRVGRDLGNDLVIDDPQVSRRHLEVTRAGDGWWLLRDLGSWNGTFLNGRRVDVGPAADGDLLQIGQTRLLVTAAGLEPQRPGTPRPASGRIRRWSLQRLRKRSPRGAQRATAG